MAVRFLLACPDALTGAQRAHVLVDDYQMHSRASQHLANLLARDSITVAADPTAAAEVFDSYPYSEGIGEFTQANESLRAHRAEREPHLRLRRASRQPPARIAGCKRGTLSDAGGKRRPRPPKVLHPRRRARRPADLPDCAAIAASFTALKLPIRRPRWPPWPTPCRPPWRREPTPPRFTCSLSIPLGSAALPARLRPAALRRRRPSGGAWPRATTATLTAAPPHAC